MTKLYFLGPYGTYSELAAQKAACKIENCELQNVSTIAKVVELTNQNENDIGVLPIENKIDGIVRPSIDGIYAKDVKIQAQFDIDIIHCLISKSSDIKNIKHIISHPQGLAQCQKFILNNFGSDIELISASSTASAGYKLNEYDESYASIVSQKLARELNYNVLAQNIGDVKDNKTRFVIISKRDLNIGEKTRTSIVFNTKNEPGALLEVLKIFDNHNLNMVYIESRPSKKVFGEYNFFVDIDKGINELRPAISEIKSKCNFYKLLGSYATI